MLRRLIDFVKYPHCDNNSTHCVFTLCCTVPVRIYTQLGVICEELNRQVNELQGDCNVVKKIP